MQIPAAQRSPHSQHGVALITALLVVSLATILAVSLVEHLYYDIRRTENILRLDQARLYNANALEFGMSLLRQDRNQNNEYDTLLEYSINNEQAYPVEGGQVFAKIIEQQGCFNLNNLSKTAAETGWIPTTYQSPRGQSLITILVLIYPIAPLIP